MKMKKVMVRMEEMGKGEEEIDRRVVSFLIREG